MGEQESFWTGWHERIAALRNVPPVLAIVWESGPGVVAAGLIFRLFASLLPMAMLWITKLIIDGIVRSLNTHQPVQRGFWWLVAAEFGFAVLGTVLTRIIDYSDSLLADKYTRHVSIRVMKHAAELDLLAYEDPVFYDRLDRARVQATDRSRSFVSTPPRQTGCPTAAWRSRHPNPQRSISIRDLSRAPAGRSAPSKIPAPREDSHSGPSPFDSCSWKRTQIPVHPRPSAAPCELTAARCAPPWRASSR